MGGVPVGSLRFAAVSAALALALTTGLCMLPTQVAGAQAPSTQVVVPATGATVSDLDGPAVLDTPRQEEIQHDR